MHPSKPNASARDNKLTIEGSESIRGVKNCKHRLDFFPYVAQNPLVFGHPNYPFISTIIQVVGIMLKCNLLTQLLQIVVISTHITRFCNIRMISKFRGKGLNMLDVVQRGMFQRMIQLERRRHTTHCSIIMVATIWQRKMFSTDKGKMQHRNKHS